MAIKWRFCDYETHGKVIPIQIWETGAPAGAQAHFATTVRHLSVTETWTLEDGAKLLTGPHAPLTELLIDFNEWAPRAAKGTKRRFRPVGFRDEDERAFILFGGCEKVGGVLSPLETFNDALRLWGEWKRGMGKVHGRDL